MFQQIRPTASEIARELPGDGIIKHPQAIIDRAFSLPAQPEVVWPWFVQLGKNRAGWYSPRWVEYFIPPSRRGLWRIEPSLQSHKVGQRIDDWGGKNGYLEIESIKKLHTLAYKSTRGQLNMSWAITLWPEGDSGTRVIIRLKFSGIRHTWLLKSFGELFDALTIAGLAAGLRQRLEHSK